MPEGEVQLNVTGQNGRRFWGVKTISGEGVKTDEPFIGQLYGDRNQRQSMSVNSCTSRRARGFGGATPPAFRPAGIDVRSHPNRHGQIT
jgi:hypothetical protein